LGYLPGVSGAGVASPAAIRPRGGDGQSGGAQTGL